MINFFDAKLQQAKIKEKLDSGEFLKTLNKNSFNRVDFVTEPGEYAVRGNIIDVFSFSYKKPIRIELDGNEVERLRLFGVNSQLTEDDVKSVNIVSNEEINEKIPGERS